MQFAFVREKRTSRLYGKRHCSRCGAAEKPDYRFRWTFKTRNQLMGMGDIILDRISFGGVKELEEVYFD